MTQPKPESGWENPDHHPDSTKRRPMFDLDGKPVTELPEPEPLTPAEVAMFAAMDAGGRPPQELTIRSTKGMALLDNQGRIGAVVSMDVPSRDINVNPVPLPVSTRSRIQELATRALDNPSPASWAVALDEILRELEA